MGVVYKAYDTHLRRPVAIKVLSPGTTSDPDRRRRFVQEARTASALNHPNIVHIYDISESGGTDFIAMEFVSGKTLDRLIGSAGLPLADVLKHAGQLAGALARAHTAGIIHRDIKPGNVMVTDDGLLKVLDFGLAKLTEAEPQVGDADATVASSLTRTGIGEIVGTVAYMSPEQAEGKQVDARSDIFSFGSLLYEMISGQRPFQGGSALATLSAILKEEPKPLTEIVRIPAARKLDPIIRRCLAKQPEQRFQSMSEVQAALAELEQVRSAPATRRNWIVAAGVAAAIVIVALAASQNLRQRLLNAFNLSAPTEGKMVAVLPFQCGDSDPDGKVLCEGLSVSALRRLSALNQFQRGTRLLTLFDSRAKNIISPADARRSLGVSLASTTTFKQADGRIQVTAAIVDTKSLAEIRRVEFELSNTDTAALNGIVEKVADLLGMRWPSEAGQFFAQGNTTIPEAFNSYLRGQGYLMHASLADTDRAIALFREAIDKDPSYGSAHAGLCESYWAKNSFAKERQLADTAMESCSQAMALKADSSWTRVTMGKIYAGTGRHNESIPEFERGLQFDPLDIAGNAGLASSYEQLGRLNDAEAAYRRLIELWPTYFGAYDELALFYLRQSRYKDAESASSKTIEFAPDNAAGYKNLATAYHYLGRPNEAIPMFKKSLDIEPTGAGYSNLATLYWYQGRYSDAVPLYEKATELAPNRALYWKNLAEAYAKVPDFKDRAPEAQRRAIQIMETQLAVNPNDANIHVDLASSFAALKDQNKALTQVAQARRIAPNDPRVLYKAVLVYLDLDRREQAIGALDLALQNGYSLAEVRENLDLAELLKDPRFKQYERR